MYKLYKQVPSPQKSGERLERTSKSETSYSQEGDVEYPKILHGKWVVTKRV